jgi:predicted phage terminase large subunit-like protein
MKREEKILAERYLANLRKIKEGAVIDPFEDAGRKRERIAHLKKHPAEFAEYYFPHYCTSRPAYFHKSLMNLVLRTPVFFILLRWGRGLAKSVYANIIIPILLWANDDVKYMLLIGQTFDKAKTLLADLQAEFEGNPRLIHDFGAQKLSGDWSKGDFQTANGFYAKAFGMEQSARGIRRGPHRPDYISADDLDDEEITKNPKRLRAYAKKIEQNIIPTMDGPRRRFIMPNNYFAPVTIQEVLRERHPKWDLIQVDAYDSATYEPAWKEKYLAAYYKEVEEAIGTLAAHAEYNNRPHIEGSIFTEDQIQWVQLPAITHFEHLVGHWDIAYSASATADYNAVRLWGLKENRFYLIDCYVKQSKMRAAVEWIADKIKELPGNVRVRWQYESQFWNDEVQRTIDEVEDKYHMDLRLRKVELPKENKYDRIVSTQPYYQNGRIFFNQKLKGHNDTQTSIGQLCGIEPGYKTKDDAPDADERCLTELSHFIRRGKFGGSRSGNYSRNNSRKG